MHKCKRNEKIKLNTHLIRYSVRKVQFLSSQSLGAIYSLS